MICAIVCCICTHVKLEQKLPTYGKAHGEGNISDGVHVTVHRHVSQVHQIAHVGHHGRVYHTYT